MTELVASKRLTPDVSFLKQFTKYGNFEAVRVEAWSAILRTASGSRDVWMSMCEFVNTDTTNIRRKVLSEALLYVPKDELPYDAEVYEALVVEIATVTPPSPRVFVEGLPEGLSEVVLKALAIVQSGAINNALCGDALNATCQQTYTFGIDPGVECQLDGVYAFTFSVACHPSIANTAQCPTAMTTLPLSINVTLDSEDICEVVQQLLQVEGTLTSHGTFDLPTFTFGAEKTSFFQEQSVHFQCTVD